MKPARFQIGEAQAALLVVGGVLGAGIFLGIGEGLRNAGAGMVVLFALAASLAGLVTRALASLALAQGGGVSFVATTAAHLGRRTAFVQGWGYWGAAVLACTAQLTAAGTLMSAWVPIPPWAAALTGLVLTAALNRSRVDLFGAVEAGLSACKVAVLGLVMLLAVISALRSGGPSSALLAPTVWAPRGVSGWLSALPLSLFAFGNVELVGLAALDLAHAQRTLKRVIVRVVLSLAVLYVSVTAALLALLPPHSWEAAANPFALVLARAGVPGAGPVMDALLVWVMISSCNACLYGATRVVRALAAERCAPAMLMTRNAQGAPGLATVLTAASVGLAVLLSATSPGRLLLPLMAGAAMLGLVNWSLFLMAHCKLLAGPRAWPDVAGLVAIMAALALMASRPAFHAATGIVVIVVAGLTALSRGLNHRSPVPQTS